MADDRPIQDPTDQVTQVSNDLADFKSTILARITRRPTGDVEMCIRSTPKDNTLVLNGQLVSRTTYAALWQWAQDNSLVIAGMFTNGDGSTTFGLPDFRGRVARGVGTLGADTYALGATGGAASRTLLTANMPSHTHTVATHANHGHSLTGGTGTANSAGGHGGHNSGAVNFPPGSGGGAVASNGNTTNGAHTHSVNTSVFADAASAGSHTVGSAGTDTAFDNRSPYLAINFLIWT